MWMSCTGSSSIYGWSQVDAAVRVSEDEGFHGSGGGAREEARGRRRLREGRMKDLGRPIYKGGLTEMTRETRRPKHHYPAAPTPRFSRLLFYSTSLINKNRAPSISPLSYPHRLPPRDPKTSSIAAAAIVDLPVRTDSGRCIDLTLTRNRWRTSAARPHP